MLQQPTSAYLRFCRVANVAHAKHCRAYNMAYTQGYYQALLACSNTGNATVAKLQAKGFAFTVGNAHALVQQLHAWHITHWQQCMAANPGMRGPANPLPLGTHARSGMLPQGCAVAYRKLGGHGLLGAAAAGAALVHMGKLQPTLASMQHFINGCY